MRKMYRAIAILLLLLFVISAQAATLDVNPKGGQYSSIQKSIEEAKRRLLA